MLTDDYPAVRREIQNAVDSEALDSLVRTVHKLNGVVRNFEATIAATSLSTMESHVRAIEEKWDQVQQDVDELQYELMEFIENENV
jgi:HPt (histidine-containing phosphotransfer) domain-containing protein